MKKYLLLALSLVSIGCGSSNLTLQPPTQGTARPIPSDVLDIMNKDVYADATWALRAVDTQTGEVLYELNSTQALLIGSVRKLYSVGTALCSLGGDRTFVTEIHRQGNVDNTGVLDGNLILVASGDVTMGGRRLPDQSMALGLIDHNEANVIGNAELTNTDPLLAYKELAVKVAAAGVTEIQGEVIVDDRLFQPFEFRGQFQATPAFVNEDLVDVSMSPAAVGQPADVDWRPRSAAFSVASTIQTVATGDIDVMLDPVAPDCFGQANCVGQVSGQLPVDGVPAITGVYPVVQNFRITAPSIYARTVFIEALEAEGVTVQANTVGPNPTQLLPNGSTFTDQTLLADYTSLPYTEYARLILKVSFNLGADTTLMMIGVNQGLTDLASALTEEAKVLESEFGIAASEYSFFDGSGGGQTRATAISTISLLQGMSQKAGFDAFFEGLPVLGIDGTLIPVNEFLQDPTLADAAPNVHAKTGTFASLTDDDRIAVDARGMAGYIDTKSGRRISFTLIVNDAGVFDSFLETSAVNQDVGTITAILWRDTF